MSTLDTEADFQANAEMVYQSMDNVVDMVNKGTLVDSKLMVLATLSLTRAVMLVYERLSTGTIAIEEDDDEDEGQRVS